MKRLLTIAFTLALFAFLLPRSAAAAGQPLYEYWNPNIGDHFYTIDINEIGEYPTNGYQFFGAAANVFATQESGTVPLYRYYNYPDGDHFYTTDWNELGYSRYGWNFERVECYVYPADSYSGIPFYEYWNGTSVLDHYYTTNFDELGYSSYGWDFVKTACRVEPTD